MCSGQKYLIQSPITRSRPGPTRRARARVRLLVIEDCQVGFPIRTSRDQRVLSPPPGLSQSATSFIASCCQGIHQTPLSRLIRSRRRRALLREVLVRNLYPLPSGRKSTLTRRRRYPGRRRQAATTFRSTPPSRSVSLDLERLLFSPRALRPAAGTHPTWQMPNSVSCFSLFTMSVAGCRHPAVSIDCRDLAIGQEGAPACACQSNRLAARGRRNWWSLPGSNR
jgi:hypothetical protein